MDYCIQSVMFRVGERSYDFGGYLAERAWGCGARGGAGEALETACFLPAGSGDRGWKELNEVVGEVY